MKSDFNEIESENLRLQSLCKEKDQEVTDMLKVMDVCKLLHSWWWLVLP